MSKAITFKLNDGREIPAVGLGTYSRTADPGQYRQAVEWAIEAGYRHIDTAAIYKNEEEVGQGINNKINDGSVRREDFHYCQATAEDLAQCLETLIPFPNIYKNEEEVGQGINNKINDGSVRREDLWVTTKLWNDQHAPKNVLPALQESLNKLKLDYVDLYLIHWPISMTATGEDAGLDFLPTWLQMEEAQRQGLTKSIGVSNFNQEQLERVIKGGNVKPTMNQIELNPTLTQYPLSEFCKSHDILVTAYTPLGAMSEMRNSDEAPAPKQDDPKLTAIGNKHGKATTQVVLRYITQRGIVAIPKSFSRGRIAANIDIFDFSLTAKEMAVVESFNLEYRCVPVTAWKGYKNFPF